LGALLGTLFAAGGAAWGLCAAFVAFMGGASSVGGAVLAQYANPYTTRPAFDFLGSLLPDGFWRYLEGISFGDGAAR
jgi:hypothetical protein